MQYLKLKNSLSEDPRKWLVTGVAGFIGSNILEELLNLGQIVVGLDNFSTGNNDNLLEVKKSVGRENWSRFTFIEGDICNSSDCNRAVVGVDYVLHQAALGSVPRSIVDPLATNASNINGFLNMLEASRCEGVKSFTYAASSSTYGDSSSLPKVEDNIGNPLSPYAVTKLVNEIYAGVYSTTYDFKCVGLRYFNVFGPRQDPNGAYAAVIPTWTKALIENQEVKVNGDGSTSRDFCYVANAVQINLLAAVAQDKFKNHVYNVAVGQRTNLDELLSLIRASLSHHGIVSSAQVCYEEFRVGDVRHSQADISKAANFLDYSPSHTISQGLEEAMPWYINLVTNRLS